MPLMRVNKPLECVTGCRGVESREQVEGGTGLCGRLAAPGTILGLLVRPVEQGGTSTH